MVQGIKIKFSIGNIIYLLSIESP